MKSLFLAGLFSILAPGLGQLYLGEKAKGWTLLCMTAGVAVSLIISHTMVAWILMGGIYLAVMIPAALDAFQTASGRPRSVVDPPQSVGGSNSRSNLRTAMLRGHLTGDAVPYVIVMLLMVGPFAIPLLWQSPKFSKTAKMIWTFIVILIALLAIAVLAFTASFLGLLMQ